MLSQHLDASFELGIRTTQPLPVHVAVALSFLQQFTVLRNQCIVDAMLRKYFERSHSSEREHRGYKGCNLGARKHGFS